MIERLLQSNHAPVGAAQLLAVYLKHPRADCLREALGLWTEPPSMVSLYLMLGLTLLAFSQWAEPDPALDLESDLWRGVPLGAQESCGAPILSAADDIDAQLEAPVADDLLGSWGSAAEGRGDDVDDQATVQDRDVWQDVETPLGTCCAQASLCRRCFSRLQDALSDIQKRLLTCLAVVSAPAADAARSHACVAGTRLIGVDAFSIAVLTGARTRSRGTPHDMILDDKQLLRHSSTAKSGTPSLPTERML